MNELKSILNKYNYKIKKISVIGNATIVETDNDKYVIKKVSNKDIKNIYKYLKSKQFYNYIDYLNDINDNYLIFPFLNDDIRDNDSKAKDLIYLMSLLHSKTYFYKSFPIDEIKKTYEEKIKDLKELEIYYDNLKAKIEETIFLSPSNYYLLRNISWIYHSINSSKFFLDKWYNIVKDKKNLRICMTHGNLELDHLMDSDNKILISWDNAKNDSLVKDIIILYNKYYNKLSFYELLSLYSSYFQINSDELYFLFSLMLFPKKVSFHKNEIINMKEVYDMISYLQTSSDIISKYHSTNTDSKNNKHKE